MNGQIKPYKVNVLRDLVVNRKLIGQLSKNDFKTKFAGSYFGIFWAFVQPIVTVLVYWFVFQVAMPSLPVQDVPYVLWLIGGLIPWFFFSDAWNGGTMAFVDYSYLVKKVVFNISIIPFVKVTSAWFTHLTFLIFMAVIYIVYGQYPDMYWLQIPYYSLAVFLYSLALSYITSSILVFFKDLSQVLNIIMQIGIWVTPILWNMETTNMPQIVKDILKLNPLYYIVNGFRDTLIYKKWFFEDVNMTIYFWLITLFLYKLGTWMFKKLRVHFADVL